MKQRSGIIDVAKAAGVSVATVSRVINYSPLVNLSTKRKVEKAIASLQYVPNRSARTLITNHSRIVALLIDRSIKFATANTLLQLEEKASALGYMSLVITIDEPFESSLMSILEQIKSMTADGVVIITPRIGLKQAIENHPIEIPTVLITADLTTKTIPVIGEDQEVGAYMLTKYLVEEGHKKIWHIAGAQNWFDGKLRVHGWRRALKEVNLQEGSKLLVSSWSPHDAYRLILDTPMDPGPTAIFAASDHIAMATISALREKGLRVPEDISIVGYDDTQESVYISPSLTTIKQDLPLVSEQAMDLLMKRMAGKEIPLVTALKPKLIIRDSVRKLNK